MTTIEEEFEKLRPIFDKCSRIGLFANRLDVKGVENFVKKGPTIIIGNHIGTLKDAFTIYKIVPRSFVFTSNRMIFDKGELNYLIRKHLKRHLKGFGIFVNTVIKPIKIPAINFATQTVRKVGAIPVDLYSSRRDAILKCQETVKAGRALILLQGRGRVMKNNPNPYVSPVRKGAAIISYNLYTNEGISGWGECYTQSDRDTVIQSHIQKLTRYLKGRDPVEIKRFTHMVYEDWATKRGSMELFCAISGIEQALWDILGKRLNQPVYNLLGGPCRKQIRVYANGWSSNAHTIDELCDQAKATVQRGFTALKFDPFPGPWRLFIKQEEEKEVVQGKEDQQRIRFPDRLTGTHGERHAPL